MNVVITGGSNGLGKSIIKKLNSDHNFNIWNIDKEILDGGFCHNVQKTLCPNILDHQVDELTKELPEKIDILINNLGVNFINWIPEISVKDFDDLIALNIKLPFLLVKKLAERMNGGTVLNIVSNASDLAMTHSLAYNMSKGAMKIGTKQMSRELSKTHNITVFGISPNKLSDTKMSEYIDNKVCEMRGWTKEEATKYQCASIPAGEETPPNVLGEFIAFLLSTKQRHKYLQGCILNYGGPMGN